MPCFKLLARDVLAAEAAVQEGSDEWSRNMGVVEHSARCS